MAEILDSWLPTLITPTFKDRDSNHNLKSLLERNSHGQSSSHNSDIRSNQLPSTTGPNDNEVHPLIGAFTSDAFDSGALLSSAFDSGAIETGVSYPGTLYPGTLYPGAPHTGALPASIMNSPSLHPNNHDFDSSMAALTRRLLDSGALELLNATDGTSSSASTSPSLSSSSSSLSSLLTPMLNHSTIDNLTFAHNDTSARFFPAAAATNNSCGGEEGGRAFVQLFFMGLAFFIIIFASVCGNLLVIFAVYKNLRLRSKTNVRPWARSERQRYPFFWGKISNFL